MSRNNQYGVDLNERESDKLTNIDGFLVTDGDYARLTFKSHLNPQRKEQVRRGLLDRLFSGRKSTVYVWDVEE